MVKPTSIPRVSDHDPRVYCDYAQLVRLQKHVDSFLFLPRLKANSALSGRHHSHFRGRGLNFEELKHYQHGDDIRNLDWKVTMRTGKPHVRSYTEEKDRNVVICVDQRSRMFFSSVEIMKSVVAAEVAALTAWRALKEGDRVGFLLVDSQSISVTKAKRSQNDLLAFLKRISSKNQSLSVDSTNAENVSFTHVIDQLTRQKMTNSTIVMISDFSDATSADIDRLKYLQRHNDVLAIMVTDPLEENVPEWIAKSHWVVGDGALQFNLNDKHKLAAVNQSLAEHSIAKQQQLKKMMSVNHLPFIELTTCGEHLRMYKAAVGGIK
ncbi:DUF58 domain-containing protein [Vibrio kyushuensis]|uniref:DUF58 domain-containing protein n=1 Tax=Vibrio kyushuensis TaxID=2910249 RepID=UPI003D0B28C3